MRSEQKGPSTVRDRRAPNVKPEPSRAAWPEGQPRGHQHGREAQSTPPSGVSVCRVRPKIRPKIDDEPSYDLRTRGETWGDTRSQSNKSGLSFFFAGRCPKKARHCLTSGINEEVALRPLLFGRPLRLALCRTGRRCRRHRSPSRLVLLHGRGLMAFAVPSAPVWGRAGACAVHVRHIPVHTGHVGSGQGIVPTSTSSLPILGTVYARRAGKISRTQLRTRRSTLSGRPCPPDGPARRPVLE